MGVVWTSVTEKADTCHTPILVALEEGVVLRSYEGGLTTGWRITEVGEGLVSFGSCLRGPQLVHWPRKDVDPKNQTTWELVDTLHSRGWHAQVWHEAAADPDHVVVNKGGPKIFYIKPHYVTLQRAYLESLVRLSEVKEKYVRHFRKPKYYIDLFKATKSVMEADKGGRLPPEARIRKKAGNKKHGKKRKSKPTMKAHSKIKRTPKLSDRSYDRGGGRLTFKPKVSSWQGTCPRCDGGMWTDVGKVPNAALRFKSDAQDLEAQRRIKHWMNCCYDKYKTNRTDHQQYKPTIGDIPNDEELMAKRVEKATESGEEE